jgi:hypothetical protein
VPFAVDDDDELFTFLADTLNVGDAPSIVFDPRHPEHHLRHYPLGLANLEAFEEIPLGTTEVTVDTVSAAIERTHKEKMITPLAQPKAGKLWRNQEKFWPRGDAEDRVQMYVEIALNAAFPTCTVRPEQNIPEGRLDIEIIENDPVDQSKITQHGVLELKVLRSFRDSGAKVTKKFTCDWIRSGVEQAAAYRSSKRARWAALVCFDMRSENIGDSACFRHVKSLAKGLEVHLRRWFMYATSKQRRSALTAANA